MRVAGSQMGSLSFFRVYMHRQVPPTVNALGTLQNNELGAPEIAYPSGDTCYPEELLKTVFCLASGGCNGPAILDTRPAAVGLGVASPKV